MTPEERFLSEGAAYFGMRLIYRNQDVGVLSSSGLVLLDEGEKILARLENIVDVEPKQAAAKKQRVVKASATDSLTPVLGADLDNLLADIK